MSKIKNVYQLLENFVANNTDRIFFVREKITYNELLTRVKKRAATLAKKLNVQRGDAVALISGTGVDFIVSYFAIVALGARALMLDTGLASGEHKNMMEHTDCKLALAQKHYFIEDAAARMHDIETPDETDESEFAPAGAELHEIANLSFTSGSTGNPKIVGLTHANIVSLAQGALFYAPVIRPGYMFYGFLPLHHIYGFVINIIAPLALSCSLLLQPVMDPKKLVADFAEFHPSIIPAVPRLWEIFHKKIVDAYKAKRMYNIMRFFVLTQGFWKFIGLGKLVRRLTKPVYDMFGGRVRVLVSAGATLKPSIRKFYESLGFSVGDCYGLTETTGPSNFNFKFRLESGRLHFAGPLPGNEIKIHRPDEFGVGDIWVRGSLVMPGYVGNEEANAEAFTSDGWFRTGDIGMFDSRGRLVVKARAKQVIVLDSGKNVYPDELEELYMQNDDILNAAIIERVINDKMVAFGVFQVKPGVSLAKVQLLLAASNMKIAPYKWVSHFAITEDELPQTSTKKVKHHVLKEMLDRGEFKLAR